MQRAARGAFGAVTIIAVVVATIGVANLMPVMRGWAQPTPEARQATANWMAVLETRANRHVEQGRYREAIVTLERLLDRRPDHRAARLQVAELYFDLLRFGTPREAHEALPRFRRHTEALIVADADDPATNLLLARFYDDAGDAERAMTAANAVLQVLPDSAEAKSIVAATALRRGEVESAARHYATILDADATHRDALHALFELSASGAITADQAGGRSALALARTVMRASDLPARRRAAAFVAIGECVKFGDGEGALEIADEAVAEFSDLTLQLARLVLQRYHARAIPGAVVSRVVSELSVNPLMWSATTEATIQRALRELPADRPAPELHALLAAVIARDAEQDSSRARMAWDRLAMFVEAQDGDWSGLLPLRILRAALALQLGHDADARAGFASLAVELPDRVDIVRRHRLLSEAEPWGVPARAVWLFVHCFEHPEYELPAQITLLRQALELAPNYFRAHAYRADLAFNRERDFDLAYRHYTKAAEQLGAERDVKAGLAFGAFFAENGAHLAQARTLFGELAEAEPLSLHFQEFARLASEIESGAIVHGAFVHFYRSALAETFAEQAALLDKAAEIQPQLFEVVLSQGRTALTMAVDLLQRLGTFDGDEFERARREMGEQFDVALRRFAQAATVARRPIQKSDALTFRARTLYLRFQSAMTRDEAMRRRDDIAQAANLLQMALGETPENVSAALLLGEIFAMQGDLVGTHRTFRDILLCAPESPLFQFDRYDHMRPTLPFPDSLRPPTPETPGVALSPEFSGRTRLRYRIDAELSGFPNSTGGIAEADQVSFRIELVVRNVPTPGYAECEIELLGVEGTAAEAYAMLVDRPFRATISTLLGRMSWHAPLPPRTVNPDLFARRAEQFASLVAPALIEAWAFDPGRDITRIGDVWQKRDADGLIHIGHHPNIPDKEAFFLHAIHPARRANDNGEEALGPTAMVVRLAALGGGPDGRLGELRAELHVDLDAKLVREATIRMMTLTPDPSHRPAPGRPMDLAEAHIEIRLTLLRAD